MGPTPPDLIMSVNQPLSWQPAALSAAWLILVSLEFRHNYAFCVHARVVLSRLTGEANRKQL